MKRHQESNLETIRAFVNACRLGDMVTFDALIKVIDPSELNNSAIELASGDGQLEIVNRLLKDSRVHPGYRTIIWASAAGHLAVVRRLLEDLRVDPGAKNNQAIIDASKMGHLDVVNCLMQDVRVDPADQGNEAIIDASRWGHSSVVNRLLKDVRVNIGDNDDQVIVWESASRKRSCLPLSSKRSLVDWFGC